MKRATGEEVTRTKRRSSMSEESSREPSRAREESEREKSAREKDEERKKVQGGSSGGKQ